MNAEERIIVALDYPTWDEARELIEKLEGQPMKKQR